MSGQTIRWAMAFVATAMLSGAIVVSAAKAPEPIVVEPVAKRDPATVDDIERELLLNKIREGDLLSQKADLSGARRAWDEARRLGEGLWPIHEGLGDSYARAKLTNEALREYQLAASLVPEKLAAMRSTIGAKRAATLSAAGRPLDALRAYLDLNRPDLFGNRMFAIATESSEAVGMIERHAEVFDARLFSLAAAVHLKAERKTEAAEAMGKFAVRVAPWDEAANVRAVQALREARRYEAAIEVCRAWVRSLPQSIAGYEQMGDLLWDAGREREAMIAYSSILEVRPGDASAHRRMGEVYLRRDRPGEALAQFERGLKASPQDQDLRARVVPAYLARLDKLKKEGKREEVVALRKTLGEMKVQEAGLFDIKVIMTWDAMSDVDMDVQEPDGTRINHNNRQSKLGGSYYDDNTRGMGPETYTLASAKSGTWKVGAHLHSGSKSTVKFVVILFEDTPREQRFEDTVVLDKTGDTVTFVRDIIIP